jgi:hypothetical protein
MFNGDPRMLLSFRQTVAMLLGVELSDIVNVEASSYRKRRLTTIRAATRRNRYRRLKALLCHVRYDIYNIESEEGRDRIISTFSTNVACGKNCSTAFTASLQMNMRRNDVTSILPDAIISDTSARPTLEKKMLDVQADKSDISTGRTYPYIFILIGLGGALLVFFVVVMFAYRKNKADKETSNLAIATRTRMVEMATNPMNVPVIAIGVEEKRDGHENVNDEDGNEKEDTVFL